MGFLEAVIAGLIVAAISGGTSYALGKRKTERKYRQKHAAAPDEFAIELRKLIYDTNPDADDAVRNARAIVAMRNNLRSALTSLATSLNSTITQLEKLVGEGGAGVVEDERAVRELLAVLKMTWPAKDAEIRVQVRKVMAELGLEPE